MKNGAGIDEDSLTATLLDKVRALDSLPRLKVLIYEGMISGYVVPPRARVWCPRCWSDVPCTSVETESNAEVLNPSEKKLGVRFDSDRPSSCVSRFLFYHFIFFCSYLLTARNINCVWRRLTLVEPLFGTGPRRCTFIIFDSRSPLISLFQFPIVAYGVDAHHGPPMALPVLTQLASQSAISFTEFFSTLCLSCTSTPFRTMTIWRE